MAITVKEVLETAVGLIGRSDIAVEEPAESGELLLLVRCFNLVESEIALDYFPLQRTDTFTPKRSMVMFSQFTEAPYKILSVTDEAGREIAYKTTTDYLRAEGEGDITVTYLYAPRPKGIGDHSDYALGVSVRMFALGVAAEFSLAHGQYAEASAFDSRFRDAIRAAQLVRHKLSLRTRRWA